MMSAAAHIVDDDPAVRDALGWLLKSRNVSALPWDSAEAFLDIFSDDLTGCVVVDIRMPGMSGIELFDQLRQRKSRLPVIFLTGHGDVPMAVRAIKEGAYDFLEKPFDDNLLVRTRLSAPLRLTVSGLNQAPKRLAHCLYWVR